VREGHVNGKFTSLFILSQKVCCEDIMDVGMRARTILNKLKVVGMKA